MKKTIMKNLLLTTLSVGLLMSSVPAFSAQVMRVETLAGKALYYNNYSGGEMAAAGCNPQVYNAMVTNYLTSRGAQHAMDIESRNEQMARQAPLASGIMGANGQETGIESCFGQAKRRLNGVARTADMIMSFLTGGFDTDALMDSVTGSIANGACQEINRVTGQMVGQYTSPFESGGNLIGRVGNQAGQAVGQAVGGGQLGGILSNGVNGMASNANQNAYNASNVTATGGFTGGSTVFQQGTGAILSGNATPSYMCSSMGIGC